ncbi:MAG: biotin--[acetyl-CoA-carboxylase] ligase [Paludibacteraceae bacterium]|nr:biotin--[acetyl-CoA-carboxylase] ligase [Paludibacteraceae bacterium]
MIEYVEEIASTNTYMLQRCQHETLPHLYTLCTFRQTAGRGQRGNGWESEPNKNISFTTVLDTATMPADKLWNVSVCVALAVAKALHQYDLNATIKWPNDIYIGDEKICGILIENVIVGNSIRCSIAGVGLNINQERFVSNAPNPTSMRLQKGREYNKEMVLQTILKQLEEIWPLIESDETELKRQYLQLLYRREGEWQWREREVTTAPMMIANAGEQTMEIADIFRARIENIDAQGRLILRTSQGICKTYQFKEIQYIL